MSAARVRGGGSDVAVTGSWDGVVRFWGVGTEEGKKKPTLECINSFEVEGYVNGLALDEEGRFVVCALGREHRLGRWDVLRKCKERLGVIKLSSSGAEKDDDDDEEEEEEEEEEVSSDDEE